MGSEFLITLYAADQVRAEAAAEAAFNIVAELDRMLSTYQEESELNRLIDKGSDGEWVKVSEELFELLKQTVEVSRKTDGAFDITAGPLVDLWHRSRRSDRLPDSQLLDEALSRVGYQWLEMDPDRMEIRFLRNGMQLESGGFGKGVAVDRALETLADYGIGSALVNGSGDIAAGDPPPGKEGWEVNVEIPTRGEMKSPGSVFLANEAITTSGDLYQFAEINGVRYSHILDPETGLGVTGRHQVILIAPEAFSADMFATAMVVMGPDKGSRHADALEGFDYVYSYQTPDGEITYRMSSGFRERVNDR